MSTQSIQEAPQSAATGNALTSKMFRRVAVHFSQLEPNPFQPRQEFSQADLEKLAQNIAEEGLNDEPKAREHPDVSDRFQLIDGERRWRAVQLLVDANKHDGYLEIKVRSATDQEMLERALDADLLHKTFNSMERAWGFAELEKMGVKQGAIGARYGLSQPAVSNAIRLLALPQSVKDALNSGHLTAGHGSALLALPTSAEMGKFAARAMEDNLSVSALHAGIRAYLNEQREKSEPTLPELQPAPDEAQDAQDAEVEVPTEAAAPEPAEVEPAVESAVAPESPAVETAPVAEKRARPKLAEVVAVPEPDVPEAPKEDNNTSGTLEHGARADETVEVEEAPSSDESVPEVEEAPAPEAEVEPEAASEAPAPEAQTASETPEESPTEAAQSAPQPPSPKPAPAPPSALSPSTPAFVSAIVPSSEMNFLKSKGLSVATGCVYLRQLYELIESLPNASRILEADGMPGALDYLKQLHA